MMGRIDNQMQLLILDLDSMICLLYTSDAADEL